MLRPYVFLGIADVESGLGVHFRDVKTSCQMSYYIGSNEEVILAQHDSHLEPALTLASYFASRVDFKKTYFGCQVKLAKSAIEESKPLNLIILPNHRAFYFREAWGRFFWKLYRMLRGNWIFCYFDLPPKAILEIIRKAATKEVFGLSLCDTRPPSSPERRESRKNPLDAAMRETEYQLQHSYSYAQNELVRLRMKPKARLEPSWLDRRSQFIHSLLEREVGRIEDAQRKLDTNVITTQNAVATLDEFEFIKNIIELARSTDDVRRPYGHILDSEEIFKVEDAFVFEACISTKLTKPCPIVVPSHGYYIRLVKVLGFETMIQLPLTLGLRLGLLPILYHMAAHVALGDLIQHRRLKEFAKDFGEKLVLTANKKTNGNVTGNTACAAMTETLTDLVASEIGGPAYLYALLRGFLFEPKRKKNELQNRLNTVHFYLSRKGFDVNPFSFKTSKYGEPLMAYGQELVELISEMDLRNTYSVHIHNSIMQDVKTKLMNGEIIAAKPSLVSNALWDAVLEKKGYLNENAAFLSILEWAESSQIYDSAR